MAFAAFLAANDSSPSFFHAPEQAHPDAPAQPHTSILIVDDDPSVRALLSYVLSDGNRDVRQAANAAEADDLATQRQPDVVIADVVMPGRSGIDLRRDLAARFPGLPVILISGYSPQQVAEFVAHTPHTSFLPKPFAITQLIEAVDRAARRDGAA